MLKDAGFADVVAEDRTWQVCDASSSCMCWALRNCSRRTVLQATGLAIWTAAATVFLPSSGLKCNNRVAQFEASLKRELATAKADKPAFVADFSEQDYSEVVGGWAAKLDRVADGEQRWGLFTAHKPE